MVTQATIDEYKRKLKNLLKDVDKYKNKMCEEQEKQAELKSRVEGHYRRELTFFMKLQDTRVDIVDLFKRFMEEG